MPNDNQQAGASENIGTRVILVVEDEETISDFIVRFLEDETPYKALAVPDAAQALESVAVIQPDLFLLDYQLPGLNGLELYDRLHAMQGLEAVPALLFSANIFPPKVLRERDILFLKKPFDLPELLQAVEKLLKASEA